MSEISNFFFENFSLEKISNLDKNLKFRIWTKFEISNLDKIWNFRFGQKFEISNSDKNLNFRIWRKIRNFEFGQKLKISNLDKNWISKFSSEISKDARFVLTKISFFLLKFRVKKTLYFVLVGKFIKKQLLKYIPKFLVKMRSLTCFKI